MSILPVIFSYFFISAESKRLLHDNSISKLNDIATLQHKRIRQLLGSKKESVKLIASSTQLRLLVERIQNDHSQVTQDKILKILDEVKDLSWQYNKTVYHIS